MRPVRVQRKRTKGWRMPEGVVYVGRGSKYGNPWKVVDDGYKVGPRWNVRSLHHGASMGLFRTAEDAARWAVVGFKSQYAPDLDLTVLRGKDLACWCPLTDAIGQPVPCHADVLLEIANQGEDK